MILSKQAGRLKFLQVSFAVAGVFGGMGAASSVHAVEVVRVKPIIQEVSDEEAATLEARSRSSDQQRLMDAPVTPAGWISLPSFPSNPAPVATPCPTPTVVAPGNTGPLTPGTIPTSRPSPPSGPVGPVVVPNGGVGILPVVDTTTCTPSTNTTPGVPIPGGPIIGGLPDTSTPMGKVDGAIVLLDKIINVGKSIWQIVIDNRPQATFTADSANAIPQGISDWSMMEGWSIPKSKNYRIIFPMQDGSNGPEFIFRITYLYGGTYDGHGQYIKNIVPSASQIQLYSFRNMSVKVSIPADGIVNAGTRLSPLAQTTVVVDATATNPFRHLQTSAVYYIRGDGTIKDVSSEDDVEDTHPIGKGGKAPRK